MGDSLESNPDAQGIDQLGASSGELRKVKPPNKKKHEEEVETLLSTIKEKEAELKSLSPGGENSRKNDIKSTRAEKIACIERLKKIETDLKALNQDVTKKKAALDRLQSTLHYKTEDRIDDQIGKMETLLKIRNFKLSEEKRIVSEIDNLRRSKKVLRDYLALKKEMDEMRDRQRRNREERDHYQKLVNSLRNREDEFKKNTIANRARRDTLKKELDQLHESKRKMIQDYKHQEKLYLDVREEIKKVKRRESFRRKEEPCTFMEAFQMDIEEYSVQTREPYHDEINLCNALISYLQKFNNSEVESTLLSSSEDLQVSKQVVLTQSACAAELEEGLYLLKKKSLDDSEFSASSRRSGKRRPSKKGRKQSVTKSLTHTPQIFSQFASLNLNAPSNSSEVQASIEQLQARKQFYKEGGQSEPLATPTIEEHNASDAGLSISDAGISLTESGMCEMSRQASNTESTENPADTSLTCLLDELVRVSSEEGTSETMSEVSEDTLGRSNSNSDSTEHGQSESDLDAIPAKESHDRADSSSSLQTTLTSSSDDNCSDATVTDDTKEVADGPNNTGSDKISGIYVSNKSKVVEDVSDDSQEDYEFDMPEANVS